ncbi:unnamed protein product [Cylindrotheca closterium]|uniref:Uncharacterized protein n=1 Tax=Cylindrotheca closterium TaxID=2856 RepID=A0AAD2G014_9STRA|nr:unnamed protein product [Cylindrotheca closterium]
MDAKQQQIGKELKVVNAQQRTGNKLKTGGQSIAEDGNVDTAVERDTAVVWEQANGTLLDDDARQQQSCEKPPIASDKDGVTIPKKGVDGAMEQKQSVDDDDRSNDTSISNLNSDTKDNSSLMLLDDKVSKIWIDCSQDKESIPLPIQQDDMKQSPDFNQSQSTVSISWNQSTLPTLAEVLKRSVQQPEQNFGLEAMCFLRNIADRWFQLPPSAVLDNHISSWKLQKNARACFGYLFTLVQQKDLENRIKTMHEDMVDLRKKWQTTAQEYHREAMFFDIKVEKTFVQKSWDQLECIYLL